MAQYNIEDLPPKFKKIIIKWFEIKGYKLPNGYHTMKTWVDFCNNKYTKPKIILSNRCKKELLPYILAENNS